MITPPLDVVPNIPSKLVQQLLGAINKLLDQAFAELDKTLDDIVVLPENCKCDDPRIKEIEEKLKEVLAKIEKLQEIIPLIDKIITGVNILVKIAAAVKASIFLTPIVGQAALLAELTMVQNATIANAMASVKQLNVLPDILNRGVNVMSSKLATVINKIGSVCPDKEFDVANEIQNAINKQSYDNLGGPVGSSGGTGGGSGNWKLIDGTGELGEPGGSPPLTPSPQTDSSNSTWIWQGIIDPGTGISWGSEASRQGDELMGSEFYSEINVSAEDLNSRLETIENLIENQRDLLASLQEAPAQSYEGSGAPSIDLGKTGDYYIDEGNKIIYGPKTNTGWPAGVNY